MYTGNTDASVKQAEEAAVYPCVYREHNGLVPLEFIADGLSLCIQGTQCLNRIISFNNRFIPVYTGNTVDADSKVMDNAVYPCVYREHV